jgi:hypothetical protein
MIDIYVYIVHEAQASHHSKIIAKSMNRDRYFHTTKVLDKSKDPKNPWQLIG